MVFPDDFERAGIFASWLLADALLKSSNEQIDAIGQDRIWAVQDMARRYPGIAKDMERAAYRGTQVGYLGSYLWNAHRTNVTATMEDAIRSAEQSAGKLSGVRSTFMAAKTEFAKVIHFWAVLSLEYGNRYPRDVRSFISQSLALLVEMRKSEATGNTFRSPKFQIQQSDFNWRVPGTL